MRSLARLETPPSDSKLPKIRVTAVAPARILTPLWTDNPDKMKMVGDQPGWVTPEDVAQVMIDLVEGEKNIGGTILEGGSTGRRGEPYDDPGPRGGGNFVENDPGYEDDMWSQLKKQLDGE